jgi:hypothetical protein
MNRVPLTVVADGIKAQFPSLASAGVGEVSGEQEGQWAWALPYVWRDPRTIPPRRFLYGGHFIRQFATATFAPGGVGKSALELTEAVAMATGRPLLGITPTERCRCWYWNGEDPREETERRLAAIILHYGIGPEELDGWLFIGSGREADLIVATQTRDGAEINAPAAENLARMMRALNIDVAIIDPFVSSHRITENDNNAVELVAKSWARLAGESGACVELVHHTRKKAPGQESDTSVEDGRGGSALLAAVRSARVLNVMSESEAVKAGIDRRRSYFRVENGKANLAPPPDGATWHRLIGVDLGNGDGLSPSDNVGVVTLWTWPDHMAGVTAADLLRVQRVVGAGRYRENSQAKDWVGRAIAEALGLDIDLKSHKAKANSLLRMWLESGALVKVEGLDDKRNARTFVEVGVWVNPNPETFS